MCPQLPFVDVLLGAACYSPNIGRCGCAAAGGLFHAPTRRPRAARGQSNFARSLALIPHELTCRRTSAPPRRWFWFRAGRAATQEIGEIIRVYAPAFPCASAADRDVTSAQFLGSEPPQ